VRDVSGTQRSSSEIKRELELRRSELQEDMDFLFRGRKARANEARPELPGYSGSGGGTFPLLPVIAAGAVIGFLLLRRSTWPLRMATRLVELAAPVMVPMLVRRVLDRD
jgi:hypothetical protein